jgi:hypothetical protein
MRINKEPPKCRLCDGPLTHRFNVKVLGKHDVKYFDCADCRSLQTETPYWLDEAYGGNSLSSLDTGAAQRNITNLAACFAISRLFRVRNAIDIGGADGLLCRLLRDYGINCFVTDKYATPTYAQGFTEPDFEKPDLVIAFEVLEHFPSPKSDLNDLFKYSPNVLLLSTALYTGQQQDWWYLVPESGQHVFFYSEKALKLIAERSGYQIVISGGFVLFTRSATPLQRNIARFLLTGRISRLIKAFVVTRATPGVWKDHLFQVEKSKRI